MPRKIQTSYTSFPSILVACMGDSLTLNVTTGVKGDQFYPAVLQTSLRALGCKVTCVNRGISGNTTAQMLTRVASMYTRAVPGLGIIYGGANDGSGTSSNLQSIVNTLYALGCTRNIIVGMHYRNLSGVSADTTSAEETTFGAIRVNQQAAVAALAGKAVYADNYAFCRARILAGTNGDAAGDNKYHVSSSDYHLSAYGHSVMAACLLATIQAQSGWIAGLS